MIILINSVNYHAFFPRFEPIGVLASGNTGEAPNPDDEVSKISGNLSTHIYHLCHVTSLIMKLTNFVLQIDRPIVL